MDSRNFAERYEVRTHPSILPEKPEIAEALEGVRKWASFFDEIVYDYLSENTDTNDYYQGQFEQYQKWVVHNLGDIQQTVRKHALADVASQKFASEINFHAIAYPTIYLFEQLINNAELPVQKLTYIQTELAIQAAEVARQRKILKSQEKASGEMSGMVGIYNGQLTEIDTQIIAIEVMKSDPERKLIIVPGPPMFESGKNRAINADFIAIDKELHQARGIQVKTAIPLHNDALVKYDNSHITLIDGMIDLGNSVPGEYRPRIGRGMSALPGLIAMDHLQRITVKDTPFFHDQNTRNELMRAKGIARELSAGRKSYIPFATENVKKKLLHDLYIEPAKNTHTYGHYYRPRNNIV